MISHDEKGKSYPNNYCVVNVFGGRIVIVSANNE